MASYDVTTPGSAVAATIQEILARRRAENQEDFLTRLKMMEFEDSKAERAERERMAREQEARQADLTKSQLQTDILQRAGLRKQDMPIGATPEQYQGIPEDEASLIFQNIVPQGPTPEGETMAPIRFFPGTRQEQEQERTEADLQDYASIASMPEGPEKQAALGELAVKLAGKGIPQLLQQVFAKQGAVFNPNTNKFIEVPAGQNFEGVVPWQPRETGLAAYAPRPFQVYDQEGNMIGGTQFLTPIQAQEFTAANPQHVLRPAGFQPGGQSAGSISPSIRNRVTSAAMLLAAAQEATRTGGIAGYGKTTDKEATSLAAAEAEMAGAVGQFLAEAATKERLPIAVQQAVTELLSNPDFTGVPVVDAVKFLKTPEGTTPEFNANELQKIQSLIDSIRGLQVSPAIPVVQ